MMRIGELRTIDVSSIGAIDRPSTSVFSPVLKPPPPLQQRKLWSEHFLEYAPKDMPLPYHNQFRTLLALWLYSCPFSTRQIEAFAPTCRIEMYGLRIPSKSGSFWNPNATAEHGTLCRLTTHRS